MDVELDAQRAVVRYTHFPYFRDVNYCLLVLGSLRTLMHVSTGTQAQVAILGYGHDWLDAEIVFP
jgi:DMSO reductase anchor subunit